NNADILEWLRHISEICLVMGLIATIIMAVTLSVLSKKITSPITQLASAAKRMSNGDYGVIAKKISNDEIGELVDIFNAMALKIKEDFEKIEYQKAELEDYNKNLEEKVDERTIELYKAKETINREKHILESILEDTLSGYWDWDFVNQQHYFSSGYKKMLGFEEFELDNSYETLRQFLFDEDVAIVSDGFSKHIDSHGKIPFSSEVRYRHKDGSTVWVLFAGHVVEWTSDNKPVEMIGCQINITNQKLLEKSLKEERELLRATLFSMGDGVITTDRSGKVEMINPVAEKLTGRTQQEVHGKLFHEAFQFISSDPEYQFKNPVEKLLKTEDMILNENHMILVPPNGMEKPIEDSVSPIRDENGNLNGVVFVFRDYSEKKEKQEKIEYLSMHDQLTGLYNRRFFEDELNRLDTAKNLPFSIVMMDVNGLKLINDAFGHAMGDLTLQRAAAIMQRQCGSDDTIARFGGDEFVILLPGTNAEAAEKMVDRIYAAFETEILDSISISVSCGWATKRDEADNIASVFRLAEDYMYRRKLSESQSMHYKTIDTILKTLHGKSEREKRHSERVGELCEAIAIAMDLKQEDIREFKTIGLMHDIGKIAIDLSILDKPGNLNDLERAEIERHPEMGYQILRSINDFAKLAEFTLSHHEKWDGTGYPRTLKGEEIPLESRIIAIADAYDSMTSDRSYRKALSKETAVKEIMAQAGTQFDPDIVKVFIEKVLLIKHSAL
ncbi:MAG: HD domain-containing phosphohydrolase, partial [Bacillota bacterium]